MKTLTVALEERSYPIEIGVDLLAHIGQKLKTLAKGKQVALLTDSNVGPLYSNIVISSLEHEGFMVKEIILEAGEHSKSWQNAEMILTTLLQERFHRDCNIIALGGGVVGDLAGFVASIYQRGVNFYQIPTSLLAQVDSSVGGKVAVNHPLGKNMIGSFYQPKAVWIDVATLDTLEERQWRNGLAEVIKYGVIFDDAFFDYLGQNALGILARDKQLATELIARCCQIKADIVGLDEREGGVRAKLNFGHTIGHGVELAGHYEGYYHGEAVAIGMVLATQYAMEKGLCDEATYQAVETIVRQYQLPLMFTDQLDLEEILLGISVDKKVQDGQWVFVLPRAIGQVDIVKNIPQDEIIDLLKRKLGE